MDEGKGIQFFVDDYDTQPALYNNLDDPLSTPTCHPTPLPAGAIGRRYLI